MNFLKIRKTTNGEKKITYDFENEFQDSDLTCGSTRIGSPMQF